MNERISRLIERVHNTPDIFPEPTHVTYDEFDEKLAEPLRIGKRLAEYMEQQAPYFTDDDFLVGMMHFDGSVEGDIFTRIGHKFFWEAVNKYYRKPIENLCIFEWQHSNQDFGKLIRRGLAGLRSDIINARKNYLNEPEHLNMLAAFEMVIRAIKRRAEKFERVCKEKALECSDPIRKKQLLQISRNCSIVPFYPAETFEQAIQCVYFCFPFLPDSIGRADQYLYPLYKKGIEDGTLSREHAQELIEELFIMIHGWTSQYSSNHDKGGESHFCVGGYTIEHKDGFNELSDLILDSMMECDLIRPQVSLRWTKETPRSVLKKVLDCERKDKNKRFAICSDEPRIEAMMKINHFPWEMAYDYIMVGCNEPAFQGGISLGGQDMNIVRCLVNTLTKCRKEVLNCETYEDFYAVFQRELFADIETALDYSNRYNMLRSRDCNVLSSLFLEGCIERAQSCTRGGAIRARTCINFMGSTNLIDSLSIIRQFVFEEKRTSFSQLLSALDANWEGYELLHAEILRDGKFFGNNDDFSNSTARRFYTDVYRFANGRTNIFGQAMNFGNLTGYHPHFATFGTLTMATPDGRRAGAPFLFGSGQSEGKDRDGITSHLLSVARMDPTGIMCGNTIMNLTVEETVVRNDESFDKFVTVIETYFRAGGLHIQLNHVSREELLAAQKDPEKYRNLRVRVSGFSAYFIGLCKDIQNNVIARTEHNV